MLSRSRLLGLLLAGLAASLLLVVGVALAVLPPGGTFIDDDGNTHEANIEAIAAEGITLGCNPPTNDRYCPTNPVTRGQMAAFLNRAFNFPASSVDYFTDDNGTTFEDDINAIAKAGITQGCNPPANDHFCPSGQVNRGQMAAFLNRTFKYPAATIDYFTDDNTSIFEPHINAIAKAGITLGCNPPDNNKYCPSGIVRRDQMASFLARAMGLTPIIPPPPTTTTTVPGVIDQGSGVGDSVVPLNLPNVPVVIELTHSGSSNFIIWSLDDAFEKVDLLVNEIGPYSGTRQMQFDNTEAVSSLEIKADGSWGYQIRTLSTEPVRSCPVNGGRDSVVVLSDFKNTAGPASLSHTGSSNFIIWAWSSSSRDLLVNEIGPYSGTVAVGSGYYMWDIRADGSWSINC